MIEDPFDALRAFMAEKCAAAAVNAGIDAHFALPNEAFKPNPGGLSGCAWYKTGNGRKIDNGMGGFHQQMNVGLLQIDVTAPENTGDGPATKAAGKFRKYFDNQQWEIPLANGYITFKTANVKSFEGTQSGFYRVIMDCVFWFYYRD